LVKDFESKPIKREIKPQFNISSSTNIEKSTQIAQQFTTAPTSPNPCISYTINNMDLITILNKERKDWIKKYHKIIQRIEIIANIQLQIQNIVKLAEVANTELEEIETMIL